MVKSLNTRWKEFLFGLSGFGPNFLMVLMGAYFTDAINPVALGAGESFQAIMSGTCFILPALFPILFAIAKAFDGIIDIPFAHLSDNLQTKWGKRRPTIAITLIPMTVSFAMCWLPIGGADGQLLNTIWIMFWALIFFATYTLSLISYYGSLSTTCCDEKQRLRVSGYKSFADTISYCLVYALVPLLLSVMKVSIDKFVFMSLPLMFTMLIPLFLIKEGEKYGYPEKQGFSEEKFTLWQSIKATVKNKPFMRWQAVNCCTFFGLQMFLVGMNAMIIGGMGLDGIGMTILNTCAFAPVPVMLYLFNKLKAKKGIRFAYQTCLISFAFSIMSFFFGSTFIMGDNTMMKMIIGCIGGVFGSWSIGAFFMMPYLATAQVASVEEKITKKNNSAMYFASNAVFTSIVGAISGSLIYENIKMLFISKDAGGIVWAESIEEAMVRFGSTNVFNLGTMLVPFIVAIVCIVGFILAFRMPKDYTPALVAKQLKENNPDLDISAYLELEKESAKQDKQETIFVQIGLSILSGFIFGFIWTAFLFKSIREVCGVKKIKSILNGVACCVIPFYAIYATVKAEKQLCQKAKELNVVCKDRSIFMIVFGVLFPILPLNLVNMALLQQNLNKIYKAQEE